MVFTDEQQKEFDGWTKEQIYGAYLSEFQARTQLNKEVNQLRLQLKEIEHKIRKVLNEVFVR